MIEWVWRRARAARRVDRVLVATDDTRIADAVRAFGGEAVMTSPNHTTGTDRIAEALNGQKAEIVVNLQGDEPLMPPLVIDRLVATLEQEDVSMATVAVPFETDDAVKDTNNVKVVMRLDGTALYFSRAPIPHCRDGEAAVQPLHHWGIYAYRRSVLDSFVSEQPTPLEQCEKLEQLRALENGIPIRVLVAEKTAADVNVPEDIPRVEAILRRTEEAPCS
jgi:3-deoxy-manno-octulosonate cytidylyltransferase (CMP-KDO synthetase)